MSMAFSGTMQGSFVGVTGQAKFIELRSGFDWIRVKNQTVSYAVAADTGAEFYFDPYTMTNGQGTIYTKSATGLKVAEMAAGTGFFTYDSSVSIPGNARATTGVTNAADPVVQAADVTGLAVGSIIRIYNQGGAHQLDGIDFTVTAIGGGGFTIGYMDQVVTSVSAGSYRIIPYNPIYYPRNRTITHITNASQAVVTTSVTHGYAIGQKVKFSVPTVTSTTYGMTEINGLTGSIVAISTVNNTFTVDIDSSGFSTWAFPLTAAPDFTPAQVTPDGQSTEIQIAQSIGQTSSAYYDTAQLGVLLMPGTLSPAGVDGNVIEWVAGCSWNK